MIGQRILGGVGQKHGDIGGAAVVSADVGHHHHARSARRRPDQQHIDVLDSGVAEFVQHQRHVGDRPVPAGDGDLRGIRSGGARRRDGDRRRIIEPGGSGRRRVDRE